MSTTTEKKTLIQPWFKIMHDDKTLMGRSTGPDGSERFFRRRYSLTTLTVMTPYGEPLIFDKTSLSGDSYGDTRTPGKKQPRTFVEDEVRRILPPGDAARALYLLP